MMMESSLAGIANAAPLHPSSPCDKEAQLFINGRERNMGRAIWVAVLVALAVTVSQARAETPQGSPDKSTTDKSTSEKSTPDKSTPDKSGSDKSTPDKSVPAPRPANPYKSGSSGVETKPDGGADVRLAPRRRAVPPEGDGGAPEGSAQTDQCAWIGKRIVGLLVRDDAMGANDFIPFYQRFQCPEDHLSKAFGCVVANLPTIENNAIGDQLDECWRDPLVRFEIAPKSDAGKDNGQHKDADPSKSNGKPSTGPS